MIISLSLLALSLGTAPALAATPYFEMNSFLSSEPVPLDAIDDDWQGKYFPNGEKQTASVWIESGIRKNGWSLGALYREELQLTFSSDTADLYSAIEGNQELAQNRRYQIDLDAYRFRGLGARVAKNFTPNAKLKFSVGASLFHASNLLEGSLSGSATANSADSYSFQFEGDYTYDEDVLFNRTGTKAPEGIGLSLDLGMKWKATQQTQLDVIVRDVAGAIRWENAPYTQAQANSATETVGADGFPKINPVLSGFEGYRPSYTQTLKPSIDASVRYQLKNAPYTASVKAKYINELSLFALGGSANTRKGTLALHYWPKIDTLETSYTSNKFAVALGLDKIDLAEARTFWLSMKIQTK